MKYTLLLVVLVTFENLMFAQQNDTTDIYVVNNTNRFVSITNGSSVRHSFFYRDLKFVKETKEIHFKTKDDVVKFFDLCDKALATDKTIITKDYNLSRNKLNKKVVRLNNKEGGYTLIKSETLEDIRKAYDKTLE